MSTVHSDRTPIRHNGMNWEIRKDFVRGMPGMGHELREALGEAMEFAGGKGAYVNFDKVLDQVRNTCGRTEARQMQDALTGPLEDLPKIIITGSSLASALAQYRMEKDCGGTASATPRCAVLHDEAKVIVSRRQHR